MASKKPTLPPENFYIATPLLSPEKNEVIPNESDDSPPVWGELIGTVLAISLIGVCVLWVTVLPVTGLFYFLGILK